MRKQDHAVEMARQGVPPRQIASRLSLRAGTVRSYISKARRAGEDIPLFPTGRPDTCTCGHSLAIEQEFMARLAPHAHSRGMTVRVLARLLLEQIARDGLVEAVLDDATTHTNEGSNDDT